MEQFRLKPRDLPASLYRVQYPDCQTVHNEVGLSARDTDSFYPDGLDSFRRVIVEAFKWNSLAPSPFIAVFSEKDHAENWALKRAETLDVECQILTISADELHNTYVFKLSTLVERLAIHLPDGALQHKKGAYLCLHRILAKAIHATESTSSILAERNQNRWAREEYIGHNVERPGTHWSFELAGYYNSDEEVEQKNMNDDLMGMIEGDWD